MHLLDKIFLLGMPGSGKTTLGKQLSDTLGFQFIDLDDLIEKDAKKSIPQIFEEDGEHFFREIESKILKYSFGLHNAVIATGGGTPGYFNNINLINDNGLSIYLDVPIDELVSRLKNSDLSQRPKLSQKLELDEVLRNTLSKRQKYYQQAHHRLTGSNISLASLEHLLEEYTNGK